MSGIFNLKTEHLRETLMKSCLVTRNMMGKGEREKITCILTFPFLTLRQKEKRG